MKAAPQFMAFTERSGLLKMGELILDTNTLPEPLLKMIPTSRVKVQKTEGVVSLFPFDEPSDCIDKMFGMFSDGKMSVDKFLGQKSAEKELEL